MVNTAFYARNTTSVSTASVRAIFKRSKRYGKVSSMTDNNTLPVNNVYVGVRVFEKNTIGPLFYEADRYVLVNSDARLMPSRYAATRYKTRQAQDLNWGAAGDATLALAHSILVVELRDTPNGMDIAAHYYKAFATVHIANLPAFAGIKRGPKREWVLTSAVIQAWLEQQPPIFTENKLAGF
jgi:hypothetical protein